MSTVLAPLYELLRHDHPWKWNKEQEEAFQASKELLISSQLLVHFNPERKVMLACDASAYGVGAVLAYQLPNGSEKPVAYASCSLSGAERNYSQLEREGLTCVFGVQKFHAYLFGYPFKLVNDHEPLRSLLSECKALSPQASACIKRW